LYDGWYDGEEKMEEVANRSCFPSSRASSKGLIMKVIVKVLRVDVFREFVALCAGRSTARHILHTFNNRSFKEEKIMLF